MSPKCQKIVGKRLCQQQVGPTVDALTFASSGSTLQFSCATSTGISLICREEVSWPVVDALPTAAFRAKNSTQYVTAKDASWISRRMNGHIGWI